MKILGIIPSRYASTRFPGKPLADVQGKSMISRVYEQAGRSESLSDLIVATDDQRIFDHVKSFNGSVVMTAADHKNGTSRCQETVELLRQKNPGLIYDAVVNIQGDEPFIDPVQIDSVCELMKLQGTEIATLVKKIESHGELFNPNVVKVAAGLSGRALYFSRNAIPFLRDYPEEKWTEHHVYYKHIGIYAYRTDVLARLVNLEPGRLEKAEKLEQLRWLENGYQIMVEQTDFESIAIDTPEDLSKINNNR